MLKLLKLSSLMIFIWLFACPATSFGQDKAVQTNDYTVLDTGIYLKIPSTWRKTKVKTGLGLRIPTGKEFGEVFLYSAKFRASAERWQVAQTNLAIDMRRDLVSQSTLDIGNVPLLLTQTSFVKSGTAMTSLSGLYYAAEAHKLLFRLEAPSAVFDDVKSQWFGVFQSLHTTDGSVLVAEDPNKPLTEAQEQTKPTTIIKSYSLDPKAKVKAALAGGQNLEGSTAARKVEISLSKSWSATKVNDSHWTLKNPNFPAVLCVSLSSTLDSPDSTTALLTLSGNDLTKFASVKTREEKLFRNSAMADVDWIVRTGPAQGATGSITTIEASVSSEDLYLIISGDHSGELSKGQIEDLKALLNSIYLGQATGN